MRDEGGREGGEGGVTEGVIQKREGKWKRQRRKGITQHSHLW